jgi:gluconate 2-dehydrogenase gamma chain
MRSVALDVHAMRTEGTWNEPVVVACRSYEVSVSRRNVLKAAAVAPAVAALPVGLSEVIKRAKATAPSYSSPPEVYFTPAELAFVEAAVARIIPKDELGPGAKEAGVADFIDHQLAGPFGRAEDWYMKGPWRQGVDEQGYQIPLTPAQLYRVAIADIDAHVHKQYGKAFAELDGAAQDKVFEAIDKDELKLPNAHARTFFEMLVQNTVEGFLADPIYYGNRDFIGWKLIGFPGPRYNYVSEIDQYGKKYDMPFVSVAGNDTGLRKG